MSIELAVSLVFAGTFFGLVVGASVGFYVGFALRKGLMAVHVAHPHPSVAAETKFPNHQ